MSLFRVDPKHPFMGPHQGGIVSKAGTEPPSANGGAILVHGRGASAQSMLLFANEFDHDSLAYRAPQAFRSAWYPYSFMAPAEDNEPGISSGLQAVNDQINELTDAGIPLNRIALLGFSQGACLILEYAARHPERYGAVIGLSGGLIGNKVDPELYSGDMSQTPVFLGCADNDTHIPESRVHETAAVFKTLNADVTKKIYEGIGHTVNQDEIDCVKTLLSEMTGN